MVILHWYEVTLTWQDGNTIWTEVSKFLDPVDAERKIDMESSDPHLLAYSLNEVNITPIKSKRLR